MTGQVVSAERLTSALAVQNDRSMKLSLLTAAEFRDNRLNMATALVGSALAVSLP